MKGRKGREESRLGSLLPPFPPIQPGHQHTLSYRGRTQVPIDTTHPSIHPLGRPLDSPPPSTTHPHPLLRFPSPSLPKARAHAPPPPSSPPLLPFLFSFFSFLPLFRSFVVPEAHVQFQHILRLLNTNVDGRRKIMYALTEIKGVGRRYANVVCKKADVDLKKRFVPYTHREGAWGLSGGRGKERARERATKTREKGIRKVGSHRTVDVHPFLSWIDCFGEEGGERERERERGECYGSRSRGLAGAEDAGGTSSWSYPFKS